MKPSITAVLEFYGAAIPRDYGGWQAMRCPFHDDRHASASVNPDEGEFYCHGCPIHGDAYGVVMLWESIEFRQAQERVSEITGVASLTGETTALTAPRKSLLPAWTKNRKPRRRVFA